MQQYHKRNPEFDTRVLEMHSKGHSMTRIAEIVGSERHTISKVVRGVPLRQKLTDSDKDNIVKMAKDSKSILEISKALNISKSRAQRILAPYREELPVIKRKPVKVEKNLHKVAELWKKGFSQKYIKAELGISSATVSACLDKAEQMGLATREIKVPKVHIRKQEKVFETKNPIKDNTYPLAVNSTTIIYVSVNIPREQALQQWKQKQEKKEKDLLKELRSIRF